MVRQAPQPGLPELGTVCPAASGLQETRQGRLQPSFSEAKGNVLVLAGIDQVFFPVAAAVWI